MISDRKPTSKSLKDKPIFPHSLVPKLQLQETIWLDKPSTFRPNTTQIFNARDNSQKRYRGTLRPSSEKKLQLLGTSSEFTSKTLTIKDVARLGQVLKQELSVPRNDKLASTRGFMTARLANKNRIRQFMTQFGMTVKCKELIQANTTTTMETIDFADRISRKSSKRTPSQNRVFLTLDTEVSTTLENRLYKYCEFLAIINLSNRIYRQLDVSYDKPLRFYIDRGNNADLVRKLMNKRFWWEESADRPNFVWTQIKRKQLYQRQQKSKFQAKNFPTCSSVRESAKRKEEVTSTQLLLKLLTEGEQKYISQELQPSKRKLAFRLKKFFGLISISNQKLENLLVTNHLICNGMLGNKKGLFLSMKLYYALHKMKLTDYMPETYYIQKANDSEMCRLREAYTRHENKIWIVKPGELTNRGSGIAVHDKIETIEDNIIRQLGKHTVIIQKYISSPYLYNGRKFDIRAFMMVTVTNGVVKGYWFEQGYIRTASQEFRLNVLNDKYTHLTNDAVQKYSENYGKYEKGNKLSYSDLQRYLDGIGSRYNFYKDAYPAMKRIAQQALQATCLFLDKQKLSSNFEIYGLDFMIDSRFKVYLIEVNTNPCLEVSCPVLARVIPNMLQNAFRVALDPQFPPPSQMPNNRKHCIPENAFLHNHFELIYDQIRDAGRLCETYRNSLEQLEKISMVEEDQTMYFNNSTEIPPSALLKS